MNWTERMGGEKKVKRKESEVVTGKEKKEGST